MLLEFLHLVGLVFRLIFVYKLNYKNQNTASKENFDKEEWHNLKIGFFVILFMVILGMLIYK